MIEEIIIGYNVEAGKAGIYNTLRMRMKYERFSYDDWITDKNALEKCTYFRFLVF